VSRYVAGRRIEWRARKRLEADGYIVVRAAGSKGPADLVAWDSRTIRLISVKSGGRYLSAVERAALVNLPRPPGSSVECWRYLPRETAPCVERL
jgi:Holliday junction resolvase